MDQNRFAALTRALRRGPSRRDVLRGLAGAGLGLGATRLPGSVVAKKKRKHKKTTKKARPNAFGCLNVGDACQNASQCCSGACKGKKGKKRCKAHDSGGCRARHTSTTGGDPTIPCTTSAGVPGHCEATTGNAGYCVGGGDCFVCTKDADCQAVCGPRAACVTLPGSCGVGTACVGPDNVVCPL